MFAKKSLGQNFLIQPQISIDMVTSAQISKEDTVVEIGPGTGVLTKELLRTAKKVYAIEKDDRLIDPLKETFKEEISSGLLEIIHDDVLKTKPPTEPYKIVANIPYYITGKIIRHFFDQTHQPKSMTLLVQKEVAERVIAREGKESILSMSIKIYGTPHYMKTVKAGNFNPVPKVDSAILHISDISRQNFENISEEHFFTLLHTGFQSKRKKLSKNIKELVSPDTFETCKIPLDARAEDISLENWVCLSK